MSSGWSLAHSQDEYDPSSEASASSSHGGGWSDWGHFDDESSSFTPPPEEKQRDAVIFLLDFTRPMHEPSHDASNEPTSFQLAVRAVVTFAKQKIIQSGGSDLIGVLLMGSTRLTVNNNSFPHLHKYLPLSHPTAAVIQQLQQLRDDSAVEAVGVGGVETIDVFNALWSVQAMFTEVNTATGKTSASALLRSTKRVFVMTCNDRPYGDASERQRALVKCRDLSEQETTLELFRFSRRDHKFDPNLFWREALVYDNASDRPEQLDVKLEGNWEELRSYMLRKVSKKRALGSVHWQLGHQLQLSVRLFVLYLEAKKEAPVFLERKSNVRLTAETRHIDTASGQYVERYQMKRYYPYGADGVKAFITDDEMKQIKDMGEPGLQLMGFKPLDRLRSEHNYRSSYFIYPDDTNVRGSTRAFSALLSGMLELQQYAVCRLIAKRGSLLRFVALLPQAEKVDDDGRLVVAGGMHMVFLPYADDMRDIRLERREEAAEGEEKEDDVHEQLKVKAKAIMVKMATSHFDPGDTFNPALQRHYAGLQAMALQEELLEDELVDELQPHTEEIERLQPFFDAFNALAFTAPGDKRRAGAAGRGGGGGGDVKRVKKEAVVVTDDEYNAVDWEALKASGEWKKVTVAELKVYLRRHKLPLSGTKDELIRRIEAHQAD